MLSITPDMATKTATVGPVARDRQW
jgi:hypothetical protein